MQKIKHLVDEIEDELCSAKEYAECYVEYRVKGDSTWSNRYKEMAMDELQHATYLHELAVQEIEALKKIYTPPVEMQEVWDKEHKKYVEKAAWVKQMLSL